MKKLKKSWAHEKNSFKSWAYEKIYKNLEPMKKFEKKILSVETK